VTGRRKEQINASGCRRVRSHALRYADARGLAQLIRMDWFRSVHAKSMGSQKVRALLVARKQLLGRLIDVELSIHGILRGFRLKTGQAALGPASQSVKLGLCMTPQDGNVLGREAKVRRELFIVYITKPRADTLLATIIPSLNDSTHQGRSDFHDQVLSSHVHDCLFFCCGSLAELKSIKLVW
jgi:hypothetical protein